MNRLAAAVAALQDVQKRNRPDSAQWQEASDALQPMFREMAKRQKSGHS